jgi:hypothetical protein
MLGERRKWRSEKEVTEGYDLCNGYMGGLIQFEYTRSWKGGLCRDWTTGKGWMTMGYGLRNLTVWRDGKLNKNDDHKEVLFSHRVYC